MIGLFCRGACLRATVPEIILSEAHCQANRGINAVLYSNFISYLSFFSFGISRKFFVCFFGEGTAVLALALTFAFAACSNRRTSTGRSDSSKSETSSKSSETSSKPSETKNNKGSGDTLPEFDKTGTIEETHLTDVYDVSITATELTYNNYEVALSLKLENKSDAKREVHCRHDWIWLQFR